MKHIINFNDGSVVTFAPRVTEGIIQITTNADLPQLDAVGDFIRVYTEDGLQYLYHSSTVRKVVSATTTEAEDLI